MSGSWVGAGGNIPKNKFNLLPDAHMRFQNHYSNNGLRYAALRLKFFFFIRIYCRFSYVSHQSSVVASSASFDRRREFGFVAQCQKNVLDNLFAAVSLGT